MTKSQVSEKPTANNILPVATTANNSKSDSTPVDAHQTRWEELQETEKKRRAILQWVEDPFWKILTHYYGTVVPVLVRDVLLYFTMAIYVAVRMTMRRYDDWPDFVGELVQGQISVVGGFIRCAH
jgi:hypothetical protein